MLLFEQFQHPNGQIPAYEWEFSDLNPPVHAWACWRVYQIEKQRTGSGRPRFSGALFPQAADQFRLVGQQGGQPGAQRLRGRLPGARQHHRRGSQRKIARRRDAGAIRRHRLDGIFLPLDDAHRARTGHENRVYEGLATKFFQHFIYIGAAMKRMGGRNYQLWDERDGFFYDVLRYPNGEFHNFRVRSLVGLDSAVCRRGAARGRTCGSFRSFTRTSSGSSATAPTWWATPATPTRDDGRVRHVLSIVDQHQLSRILERAVRSRRISFAVRDAQPLEISRGAPVPVRRARSALRAGRGGSEAQGRQLELARADLVPDVAILLIESLLQVQRSLRPRISVNAPAAAGGPSRRARWLAKSRERMIALFTREPKGGARSGGTNEGGTSKGGATKFQQDPHWRDLILFHEYFHGDNGAGLGASHQTGWTALVANLIDEWRQETASTASPASPMEAVREAL